MVPSVSNGQMFCLFNFLGSQSFQLNLFWFPCNPACVKSDQSNISALPVNWEKINWSSMCISPSYIVSVDVHECFQHGSSTIILIYCKPPSPGVVEVICSLLNTRVGTRNCVCWYLEQKKLKASPLEWVNSTNIHLVWSFLFAVLKRCTGE